MSIDTDDTEVGPDQDTRTSAQVGDAAPVEPALHPAVNKVFVVAADIVALALALAAAVALHVATSTAGTARAIDYALPVLAFAPIWPVVFAQQGLYRARFITRGIDETARVAKAVLGSAAVLAIATMIVDIELARRFYLLAIATTLVAVTAERLALRQYFNRARSQGRMMRRVLVVGKNDEGELLRSMLVADPALGYEVVGFLEAHAARRDGETDVDLLADPTRAVEAADRLGVGGVIVAVSAVDVRHTNRLIRVLTEHGIHVELSSTLFDVSSARLSVRPLGRVLMMYIEPVQRNGWRALAKRGFDLVAAALLLVLLSPILAAAALAVRLTSPGGALFRQERVGRDGETFRLYKFRTMVDNAEDLLPDVIHLNEASGPLFKIRDDPRVTRVGRFLRRTSIDELPQLINVLRNEMSLVGPRPALPSEVAQWHDNRLACLSVKPGLTGIWQVSGRSDAGEDDYGRLDVYYVDNWNLVTDVIILAKTIPAVLAQRGAY